jgi:hypothetical protein
MGCLQHQQGVHFSLCTRRHFLILQNELGPNSQPAFLFFLSWFSVFTHGLMRGYVWISGPSSRAANRGILLADSQSDELYSINAMMSDDVRSSSITHTSSPSSAQASVSALTRLKQRFNAFWLSAVRKWPTVHLCTFYGLGLIYISFTNYFEVGVYSVLI